MLVFTQKKNEFDDRLTFMIDYFLFFVQFCSLDIFRIVVLIFLFCIVVVDNGEEEMDEHFR